MNSVSATQAPQKRILVADDEPIVLNLVCSILRRRGYEVIPAPDGAKALELFREDPTVDLVLTDVMMPSLSGPQLMHRIHEVNSEVRCIFMSGYSPEQIREKSGDDPGCDYLRKPFTPEILLKAVQSHLVT
jgi:CheY-like chemotaxis protein